MNFTQEQYEAYLHRNAPKDILKSNPADAETYESDLHDKIIAECRRRGWIALHSRMDQPTTRIKGEFDFSCILPFGVVLFFECKAAKGKLRPEQVALIFQMERLGHKVHVITGFSEFLEICNTALSAKQSGQ